MFIQLYKVIKNRKKHEKDKMNEEENVTVEAFAIATVSIVIVGLVEF